MPRNRSASRQRHFGDNHTRNIPGVETTVDKAAAQLEKSLSAQPGQVYTAQIYNISALLKRIPTNPSFMFNFMRNRVGASVRFSVASGTFVVPALKKIRVEGWLDISSLVQGLATDVEQYPKFQAVVTKATFRCTTGHFCIIPFLARLENGETITATDVDSEDPIPTVVSACGAGDKILVFGPAQWSSQDVATGYHILEFAYDLSVVANMYSRYYSNKELEEENAGVLWFGLALVGAASTSVSYIEHKFRLYSLIDRSMSWK
jgi:hypothetical protein